MPNPTAYLANGEPIADEAFPEALAKGQAHFLKDQDVHFVDPTTGEYETVKGAQSSGALQRGLHPISQTQYDEYARRKAMGESGAQAAAALGLGVAKTLTFGATDALVGSTPKGQQYLQDIEATHPTALGTGEALGYALPIAGELGLGGKAVKAATAAPRALSAVARGAGEIATKGLEESLAKKVGRGIVEGAIEGTGFATQEAVSDHAIHDEPITASRILFGTVAGGALGGTLGAVSHFGGKLLSKEAPEAERLVTKEGKPSLLEAPAEPVVTPSGKPSIVQKGQVALDEMAQDQALKGGVGAVGSDIARIVREEGPAGKARLASRILDEAEIPRGASMPEKVKIYQNKLDENNAVFRSMEDTLDQNGVSINANNVLSRVEDEVLAPLRESGIGANRKLASKIDDNFLGDFRKIVTGENEDLTGMVEDRANKLVAREKENLLAKMQEAGSDWQTSNKSYARMLKEANRVIKSKISDITAEARQQILEELGPQGKPTFSFKEMRDLRGQIDNYLGVANLYKPEGELTALQRQLKNIHYSIEHEIDSQLNAISPKLADQYIQTKLGTKDWERILKIAENRAGHEAGNRFLSLTDTIWGGAGAVLGGPIGFATGLAAAAANKLVKSNQASLLVARAARKLSGEASTIATPNLIREASEAAGKSAQAVEETVSKSRFSIPTMNKAAAYQVPVSIAKGTASLIDFVNHLSRDQDQIDPTQDTALSHLDGQPGIQQEVALTQAKAKQMALELAPHADQPINPSLGDHQPPPPQSAAREYADLIHLMDKPSNVLEHFNKGTLTRKQVGVMQALLPPAMGDLQKHVLTSMANGIEKGQTPSYQMRLRMGMLTGAPVDPSDTPQFTATVQTIYQQIPMQPKGPSAPKARRQSKIAERRETAIERLEI